MSFSRDFFLKGPPVISDAVPFSRNLSLKLSLISAEVPSGILLLVLTLEFLVKILCDSFQCPSQNFGLSLKLSFRMSMEVFPAIYPRSFLGNSLRIPQGISSNVSPKFFYDFLPDFSNNLRKKFFQKFSNDSSKTSFGYPPAIIQR